MYFFGRDSGKIALLGRHFACSLHRWVEDDGGSLDWFHGKLSEGCHPRKALFGGIAFPTKVTLGSFLPSMFCVVKLPNNNAPYGVDNKWFIPKESLAFLFTISLFSLPQHTTVGLFFKTGKLLFKFDLCVLPEHKKSWATPFFTLRKILWELLFILYNVSKSIFSSKIDVKIGKTLGNWTPQGFVPQRNQLLVVRPFTLTFLKMEKLK